MPERLAPCFKSSLQDFLRINRIVVWVAVGILTALVGLLWKKLAQDSGPAVYNQVFQMILLRIVALVSAIFTAMVISQEVEQKTIVYLITRSLPRTILISGRFLASLMATIVLSIAIVLITALAVMQGSITLVPLIRDILVVIVGCFAYGSFFLFLSLILNRAMIYSLLFAFGWETLVPNIPGDMSYLSIYTYLKVASTPGSSVFSSQVSSATSEPAVPIATAWLILVGIGALFFCLSLWWFKRFEYMPREDGD